LIFRQSVLIYNNNMSKSILAIKQKRLILYDIKRLCYTPNYERIPAAN